MNEQLRKLGNEEYERHQSATAASEGVGAVEQELFNERTDVVQIAVYVNGRMIHTKTDNATVARVMALLTGLAD